MSLPDYLLEPVDDEIEHTSDDPYACRCHECQAYIQDVLNDAMYEDWIERERERGRC